MFIHSQTAVSSSVDNNTVTFLFKTAPDMLTHTESNPSASRTMLEDCSNPTVTTKLVKNDGRMLD